MTVDPDPTPQTPLDAPSGRRPPDPGGLSLLFFAFSVGASAAALLLGVLGGFYFEGELWAGLLGLLALGLTASFAAIGLRLGFRAVRAGRSSGLGWVGLLLNASVVAGILIFLVYALVTIATAPSL